MTRTTPYLGLLTIVLASCAADLPEPAWQRARKQDADASPAGRTRPPVVGHGPKPSGSSTAPAPEKQAAPPVAAPTAPVIGIPQRIAAWKSRLKADQRVVAEKTIPGFGYACANTGGAYSEVGEAILVSPHGEAEGPMGRRSHMNVGQRSAASAMVEAGDLDADGRSDLLMTWEDDGAGACAVYLARDTGPVQAWETRKSATCFVAPRNGQRAVYLEIPPPPPAFDGDAPTYEVLQWNGKGFAAAAVDAIPEPRRPAAATPPLSGRCEGVDDHTNVSGPGASRSWAVSGKVQDGLLLSVAVVGNDIQCSGGAMGIDLPLGKEKTVAFTWSVSTFKPDTPPTQRQARLRMRVTGNRLWLRGSLCGSGVEQDTEVPCTYFGPDDIVQADE